MPELHVVTGAFGYSGSYIARRLLEAGHRVRTVTSSPDRADPLRDRVEAMPFHFDQPEKLTESLRGATALYNTYWVRFTSRGWQPCAGCGQHPRAVSARPKRRASSAWSM